MNTFDVQKDYSREEFERYLSDFLPDDFEPREDDTYYSKDGVIESIVELGTCQSLDLSVYEVQVSSENDARISVTKEMYAFMKKVGSNPNVLAVFFNPVASAWRFSLITTDYSLENGKIKANYSNPRRFSFLLGSGCKAHTPETMLFDKGKIRERTESGKSLSALEDLKSRFDIEVVTKEFYNNLFAWYEWACETATFPTGDTTQTNGTYNVRQTKECNELNLIRLITRLMFVWFIKQKNLIPEWIFDEAELKNVLSDFDSQSEKSGNYYNAVIQNLFFATLNKKIEERAFADDKKVSYNKQFGVKNYYRDNRQKTFFAESNEKIIERFRPVPFLNGGLFECLDRLVDDKDGKKNIERFTDGFSREPSWMAFLPNALFFNNPRHSERSEESHEGLIHLLSRYNFTVEENSPSDVQVALDPELLGKVFENLLGTYNPETRETARKDSGSFYTPREIVAYMVDESLKQYLLQKVGGIGEEELDSLFDDTDVSPAGQHGGHSEPRRGEESMSVSKTDSSVATLPQNDIQPQIVNALKTVKILDPACGSGAFPMGALQRIVHLIEKCGGVSADQKSLYELKLSLIENCLYGVDIQSIAVQICKLRFFISLICEQEKTDDALDNYGFNPLPNLETKFVAANTLIGMKKKEAGVFDFSDPAIEQKKAEILKTRHEHFNAPTAEAKAECRRKDKILRGELAKLLEENEMFAPEDAKQLTRWNPYDQNAVSPFFDAEWMFGVKEGFDIVIGNPPYISAPSQIKNEKLAAQREQIIRSNRYRSLFQKWDVYIPFIELGTQLCVTGGITAMIVPFPLTNQLYAKILREVLVQEHNLIELCDLHDTKVFENATVQNCIPFVRKRDSSVATLPQNDKKATPQNDNARHSEHSGVAREESTDVSAMPQHDGISHSEQYSHSERSEESIFLTEKQDSTNAKGFVYIVSNRTRSTLYIGVTSDLKRRIYEHKNHVVEGFTDKYNCEYLVYFECFSDIKDAIEREKYLKGKKREFKENLIQSINPKKVDLYDYLFRDSSVATLPQNDKKAMSQYDKTSHSERSEESADVSAMPQHDCISHSEQDSHSERSEESVWISHIDEKLRIRRAFQKPIAELVQDEKTQVWNVTQEKRETNRHADMHVLGDYCYVSYGLRPNSDEKTAKGEFKKEDLISDVEDTVPRRKYIEAKDIEKYQINRIRYLEYGTERSPAKLTRPTFNELYEPNKIMFNVLGELTGTIDYEKLVHNHSLIACVLWKDLHGVENKSIAQSIKKFSTMKREEMEKLSERVDLRYLLGVMNSRYASVLLTNLRGGDYHIYPEHIRNIPIPAATGEQQAEIIALVDKILDAKKRDVSVASLPQHDGTGHSERSEESTLALEREIDRLVYQLYGLTDEEIEAVEGR